MADPSIVADVSVQLIRLLRQSLCPELVASPESIALASPTDKNADFQVGLFLYDLKEASECRSSVPIRRADNTRIQPPKPLSLSYLLFLNSRAQIAAGAETEQRVLVSAIQAVMDAPVLDLAKAHPFYEDTNAVATVTLPNLDFDAKAKIWASLNIPYQLAAYLAVSPVPLSSRRKDTPPRVVAAQFEAEQIFTG